MRERDTQLAAVRGERQRADAVLKERDAQLLAERSAAHGGGGRARSLYATPPPPPPPAFGKIVVLGRPPTSVSRENCLAPKAPNLIFMLCVYTQHTQNFVEKSYLC